MARIYMRKPSLVHCVILFVLCLFPTIFFAFMVVETMVGKISHVPLGLSLPSFFVFTILTGMHVYFTVRKMTEYREYLAYRKSQDNMG